MTPIFFESGAVSIVGLTLGIILFSWISFLETRRRKPAATPSRLAAAAVMIVGLLLLFLRPGLVTPGPDEAWLITPGGETMAASIRDESSTVFSLVSGIDAGATTIPDAAWLGRNHPQLQRVNVTGHGLRWWDWSHVPGTIDWRERETSNPGFSDVTWRRDFTLGEELVVQGSLTNPPSAGSIQLLGPGGVEASLEIGATAVTKSGVGTERLHFELRALPRDTGRFLYRLAVPRTDSADSIEEWIDVQVRNPGTVAVLWLEAAPGFETRHFKQWLAAGTNPLVVRSTVSRDRHRGEFHNFPKMQIEKISRSLLARFSLVVMDARTLKDLAPDERNALHNAVEEGGLGALLLIEENAPAGERDSLWSGLAPQRIDDLEELIVRASWPGVQDAGLLTIPAREFEPAPGIIPLVTDASGRILVAARAAGAGFIGASVLGGTYRWVLDDQADLHGDYWSYLVSSLAGGAGAISRWRITPGPVIQDHPLSISLVSPNPAPEAFLTGANGPAVRLALRQSPMEPTHWETTLWPEEPGWHHLTVRGEAEVWFHAQPGTKWLSWQQARRRDDTQRRILNLPVSPSTNVPEAGLFSSFSRLWLLPLFLVPLFGLWVSERRD